jgi:hypothetical protein
MPGGRTRVLVRTQTPDPSFPRSSVLRTLPRGALPLNAVLQLLTSSAIMDPTSALP